MQLLQQLPRAWRVALLTFGSAVSVYQLGHTGLVTADMVSGEWQPATTSSKQQQQQQHAALPIHHTDPLHVASLQSCQGVAENVVDSWRCVVVQISFALVAAVSCCIAVTCCRAVLGRAVLRCAELCCAACSVLCNTVNAASCLTESGIWGEPTHALFFQLMLDFALGLWAQQRHPGNSHAV